jgi:hypothetical protein
MHMETFPDLRMYHLVGAFALAACGSTQANPQSPLTGGAGITSVQAGGGAGTGATLPAPASSTGGTSARGAMASGGAGASVFNPGAAGTGQAMSMGGTGVSGSGVGGGGTAGKVAGAAGAAGMASGGTGAAGIPGDCSSLPAAMDYAAKGPFDDAKMIMNTGPSNNYTLFRPDASLGKNGFKHPIATWGNGITTSPSQYVPLLTTIASHGFVVIASNDTTSERPALADGLDWLVQQNMSGDMQGKLDTTKELAIGYSWGGGAAIDVSDRPNIVATVSFHGMPPRQTNAFQAMHSPLLLFTSTGDTFVTASGYVTPNYDMSMVQTFYATLNDASFGHTSIIPDAGPERGPAIAWLRFWACKDENARKVVYGDDCTLCTSPFTMPQRKNWK